MKQKLWLFVALLLFPWIAPANTRGSAQDMRQSFEKLDQQHDQAGIAQLWLQNPGDALGVIDSYLEGSLALRERDPKADPARIAGMLALARRGALAADQAFQTAIFSDYASSFSGWSPEEQTRFRRGQTLFREASKAMRGSDFAGALEKARASWDLSRPLGDWWGAAMALGLMGQAHAGLGQQLEALDCAAQARLIDHDLRLLDSELSDLLTMARAAIALGRMERAEASATAGSALALRLADLPSQLAFAELVLALRERAGDAKAIQDAKDEVARLRKAVSEFEAKLRGEGK